MGFCQRPSRALKTLNSSLQGPMSQHPSSLRVNYTSSVPSCSSIIRLRYLGTGEHSLPSGFCFQYVTPCSI